MEIELAWGAHQISNSYPHLSENREKETKYLERFLNMCDEYAIPISFDIVGYLFNEEYESVDSSPHKSDWLPVPRGSNINSHPIFYGVDLIERIISSRTEHEICSHSYTHPILGERADEVINWELNKASMKHENYGLEQPVSFVPPQHSAPPSRILKSNGFQIVRFPVYPRISSNIKQYIHFFLRKNPVKEPQEKNEITRTYCTQNTSLTSPLLPAGQSELHPTLKVIPRVLRKKRHLKFLQSSLHNAIQTDSHVHYWTHLFNLSNDIQYDVVSEFVQELNERYKNGDVEFKRMKDIPNKEY